MERIINVNTVIKKFTEVWKLEVHLKLHRDVESFECNVCSKTFHLKWRPSKHRQMHSISNTNKKCHYFNNDKSCPYQDVGCMFLHQASEACYFDSNCRNKLCPHQHKSLEKIFDQISQKNDAGKVSENTLDKRKQN